MHLNTHVNIKYIRRYLNCSKKYLITWCNYISIFEKMIRIKGTSIAWPHTSWLASPNCQVGIPYMWSELWRLTMDSSPSQTTTESDLTKGVSLVSLHQVLKVNRDKNQNELDKRNFNCLTSHLLPSMHKNMALKVDNGFLAFPATTEQCLT